MAKSGGAAMRGWTRTATGYLFPRGGDTLWYAIAVLSILSLLSYELSRRSVLAADFEGFDAEEDDEEFSSPQPDLFTNAPLSPLPTTLTQSSPESDHGPPQSVESPPPEAEDPSPPIDDAPKPSAPSTMFENGMRMNSRASRLRSPRRSFSCPGIAVSRCSTSKAEEFQPPWDRDGKDTPLLLKEASDIFKFYASGRRFCQGLLATIELRSRHDLISRILDLLLPKQDTITFEVVMNDDAMDQVVFAVAKKKLAKVMQKEERDLQRYASVLATPPAGRKWVPDELLVVSESKEVFGEKAFKAFGKGFISMHFSDQYQGSPKKLLVFKFLLPDARSMAEMTRLVTLIPYYIDLIGRYKLSPQARSKTEAARTKVAQEAYKELQNERQEALQRKKAEKKKLMEAEAKVNAEALRRKEEKDRSAR
ncbi:unnamed protein product [Spirodela intermedia]|uniref:Uncharacterized protein n=1 Tax=Spirodela intermedia TaxID=51605 RepID=A0A7I8IRL5_SPIIN|nr:unnamed protein product [Spirodela intermedia]CAA6660602.1 unnamed protein product [Spirodela intermedia]